MSYSINFASIFLSLGLTVFFYLAIPLIISALIYKKKQYVRYTRVIIINAIVVFILFSALNYSSGQGVGNTTAALLWSLITFFICRGVYDKKQTACPACKKPSPVESESCLHCGAKLSGGEPSVSGESSNPQ